VVLLLETPRVLRHNFLHLPEEGQTDHFPPRLPPFNHVLAMVGSGKMGAQRLHLFAGNGEQFHTRTYVLVLRFERAGPENREVFVVEKVFDHNSTGS